DRLELVRVLEARGALDPDHGEVGRRASDEQAVANGEAADTGAGFPAAGGDERGGRGGGAGRRRGGARRRAVEPPLGAGRRRRRRSRRSLDELGVEGVGEPDRLRPVRCGGRATTGGGGGGDDRD